MSESDLRKFLVALAGDEALRTVIFEAKDWDSICEVARGLGYSVSQQVLAQSSQSLSDQDLERISGGRWEVDTINSCKNKVEGYCDPAQTYAKLINGECAA